MKPLLIGSLAVVMLGVLSAQEPTTQPDDSPVMLFPILKDGKWGYMDQAGQVIIQPQYELAWDFHEGLACVGQDALRGYIDRTGKLVIPMLYGWAGDFSEGLVRVDLNRDKFGKLTAWYQAVRGRGYLDMAGKLQISISYGTPFSDFSEGVALTSRGYIGRDGKPVAFEGEEGSSFTEGLAAVRKGVLWGYMDRTMKPVIEPQFHAALWFSDGLAAVAMSDSPPPPGMKSSQRIPNLKWGYIDKTGKRVIDCQFRDVRAFSEGLAAVRMGERWGYIDKRGVVVIDPQFDYAWEFSEGLGRVLVGEKQGYVNRNGKAVIEPRFDTAWEFSRGLARVGIDDKEGYIDAKGNYVWEPTK